MSCSATLAECSSSRQARATVNPCTLCAPLGAVLAAAGVEGAMSLLHGAQGCATYIRRYIISHFREPMDVASSSFTEASAVMGGEGDFARALDNIQRQYQPQIVAVGTTCLAETIGEDLQLMIRRYESSRGVGLPIVHASTPSYRDGHVEGYHAMVLALVRALVLDDASSSTAIADEVTATANAPTAAPAANEVTTTADAPAAAPAANEVTATVRPSNDSEDGPWCRINVLPPIVSPADLRHLRELVLLYGLEPTMLPDYSDPLDAPISDQYHPIPSGGTPLSLIRTMASSLATIDFTLPGAAVGAGHALQERGVARHILGLPIGVQASDAFMGALELLSGRPMPDALGRERGRLLDAYADGHKYVYGKRVAVYGDPELVVAVAAFLLEIGARPVLCATGARNLALSATLARLPGGADLTVLEDTDFATIESKCGELDVELMIGSSKGYRAARSNGVPLLRLGFPIHDRIGASRILSVGYRGTLALFDAIVNTLLERMQDQSKTGFSYL